MKAQSMAAHRLRSAFAPAAGTHPCGRRGCRTRSVRPGGGNPTSCKRSDSIDSSDRSDRPCAMSMLPSPALIGASAIRTLATLTLAVALGCAAATAQDTPPQTFKAFLDELWPDAQAKGVTRATFDLAFAGVTPDPRVMGATRRQPEYGKPFGGYVASMVSSARIATGRSKASGWADTLAAIEKTYEVDPSVIVAIWGVEVLVRRRQGQVGRDPLARDPGACALAPPLFPQ